MTKQDWSSRWPTRAQVTVEFMLESDDPLDIEKLRETIEIYIESGALQESLDRELRHDRFSTKFAGFRLKVKGRTP